MGYIEAGTKQQLRETRDIAVVTRLKENMLLVPPFESCERAVCGQGQPLNWLGYEAADQLHWFGVTDPNPLCQWCWESAQCARQFSHSPAEHETLLGLIPMNTRVSQRLLQQVRPWIEPAQSYREKPTWPGRGVLEQLALDLEQVIAGGHSRVAAGAGDPGNAGAGTADVRADSQPVGAGFGELNANCHFLEKMKISAFVRRSRRIP